MSNTVDRLVDATHVRAKVTRGGKPVSDMTLHRWLAKGVVPRPDRIIEGKRYWKESIIDAALGLARPDGGEE